MKNKLFKAVLVHPAKKGAMRITLAFFAELIYNKKQNLLNFAEKSQCFIWILRHTNGLR